jgi:transposase
MAPRLSPALAQLYDQATQKGNANRATLAVARKLVAYFRREAKTASGRT